MFNSHIISTFFFLSINIIICTSLHAQKTSTLYLQGSIATIETHQRSCIDTITDFFQGSTVSLFASSNGGFVTGNNGFNDSEKLQLYNHFQNYSILGAWVWFGAKIFTSASATSGIETIVIHTDSTSSAFPPFIRGPSDSILATKFFPISDITASEFPWLGLNYIEFDQPVLIRDGYALGIRLTSLAPGDTLGIISSADGEPNQARRSWEMWDGIYGTILDNWGLNIDMAIFPIVDCELNHIQNILPNTIEAFPNPATNSIRVNLPLSGQYQYSIFNNTGRNVTNGSLNTTNAAASIDIEMLQSGVYTLFLFGKNRIFYARFTKHIR